MERDTSRSNGGGVIGILMLDTKFPRVVGDGGNPDTWPFPVLIEKVQGATPHNVVDRQLDGLLDPFIDGAKRLVERGANGIATTCGFLALFQRELAEQAGVPVAASSIIQVPWVQCTLPTSKRVGIITADSRNLTPKHFAAAGVALDTPVVGTETGNILTRVFTDKATEYDWKDCEADLMEAANHLVTEHPEVGAIVLECTNMPPFGPALADALGLPVYDVYTMVNWFQMGLKATRFPRVEHVRAEDWQPRIAAE
jgi:Asp/Glu/hydantoin racemase